MRNRRIAATSLALALLAGCGSGHKSPAATGASAAASATSSATPSTTATATAAPATAVKGAVVTAQAFGMHALQLTAHPYPSLPFGSARLWDMGVTWKDLQPTATTPLTGSANGALSLLDTIVSTFRRHHVQPLLTLGMTPDWAARHCRHAFSGNDWGVQTCAPKQTGAGSPWARYVKAIATRYRGSVKYFETWNEPSLANGWNDGTAPLAQMQQTAHDVLRSVGAGQQLLSPGVPFTNGPPSNGLNWLAKFFARPGGTAFDIVALHLYPADDAARAGTGPEWSVYDALPQVRALLANAGVGSRPVWNTETNVGRQIAKTGYRDTAAGAAAVARTYLLAASNGIARTFWYAADDRGWGGTWLETAGYSPSVAGAGYATAFRLLDGLAPLGCDKPAGDGLRGVFTCRFGDASGALRLVAVWTTGHATTVVAPDGATAAYTVTGARHSVSGGAPVQVTAAPTYLEIG